MQELIIKVYVGTTTSAKMIHPPLKGSRSSVMQARLPVSQFERPRAGVQELGVR